jgi:hypothetical protein
MIHESLLLHNIHNIKGNLNIQLEHQVMFYSKKWNDLVKMEFK